MEDPMNLSDIVGLTTLAVFVTRRGVPRLVPEPFKAAVTSFIEPLPEQPRRGCVCPEATGRTKLISTPFVTNSLDGKTNHSFTTGAALSSGNTSNQLEDATMRSQFNKQGTGYHVLSPVVHDPVTIVVPSGRGTLLQTRRGVPGRSRDSQRVRRQPENAIGSLAARVFPSRWRHLRYARHWC
jgi:hypothetical protein